MCGCSRVQADTFVMDSVCLSGKSTTSTALQRDANSLLQSVKGAVNESKQPCSPCLQYQHRLIYMSRTDMCFSCISTCWTSRLQKLRTSLNVCRQFRRCTPLGLPTGISSWTTSASRSALTIPQSWCCWTLGSHSDYRVTPCFALLPV